MIIIVRLVILVAAVAGVTGNDHARANAQPAVAGRSSTKLTFLAYAVVL